MKICVLQVSYEGSTFEDAEIDPPRNLSALLPEHTFHHAFLRKATTFRQIRDLRRQGFDIYVNLCDVYPEMDVPSVDVIWSLEHFGLPYTGPDVRVSMAPKHLMKYVAHSEGIAVPAGVVVESAQGVVKACAHLRYPLFVKPNEMGDSFGIDEDSLVHEPAALERKVCAVIEEYDSALVEEYIEGREFSVLVCAHPDPRLPPDAYLPVEFRFPAGESFKTYDLKQHQYHPECNVPCTDPDLAERLKSAARAVFTAFSAQGYARMDFRLSQENDLYFLESNFDCSLFYPPGLKGTADYILELDGLGAAGFLRRIIEEALARHARQTKCYAVRPSRVGYGVFATRRIARGEVVMPGEEMPHRLVTRAHVERTWSAEDRAVFDQYAYPVGPEVYAFWSEDPAEWAPQNHSCEPNTGFAGLDVVSLREIAPGEELTIDYARFYGEQMTPFDCDCGSPRCRGRILGSRGDFGVPRRGGEADPRRPALRQVERMPGYSAAVTTRPIPSGDVILSLQGHLAVAERTRHSIQVGRSIHLAAREPGRLGDDDFINHSCSPNAFLDVDRLEIRALKDLPEGEEVFLDYCATEEELCAPFACDCGSPSCYGVVRGYRFLSPAQREALGVLASPWLKAKYCP